MEDEKNITNNEENNYEDIDIIEDAGEVTYSEVVQIVEIDESEPLDVGTDSAFPALGDQTDLHNHAKLNNRDLPEQHPITAITGLREELDGIHALKTVESDKMGYANYYMWIDEEVSVPSDKTGYFVSIHTGDHKISRCNTKDEIFGVTVNSTGFAGWQHYDEEGNPRDGEYALVATTGLVEVRCEYRVVAGNYVISNNYGEAMVSPNGQYGYYVISKKIDERTGETYAVISLDSTMNQIYQLSEDVSDVKQNLKSVGSVANAALNAATSFRDDCKSDISSALQNSQNALENSNSALGAVENLGNEVTGVIAKVDAVNDQIIIAAHDAVQEKIKDLNSGAAGSSQEVEKLQKEISEVREDVEQSLDETRELSEKMEILEAFEDGDHKGLAGIVASAQNQTVQLAAISKCLSNDYISIDTWDGDYGKNRGQIYYAKDTGLYYYFYTEEQKWISTPEPSVAGLSEAIASVRQKADKDQAMVENLVSFSGKTEETVTVWDRYEEIDSWERKKYLADPYIIYYDKSTQLYWQCDLTNLETPWSSSEDKPSKAVSVLTDDDINKVYYAEDTKLYYCYYNGGWHSSEASTAKLVKSIALIKQTADANSARIEELLEYDGPDSDTLAAIRASVQENESNIEFLTSYAQKGYTKLDEPWNPTGKDENVVYYAKDPKDDVWKYWYYKDNIQTPDWFSSVGAADAGLIASLADVSQTVTDQGTEILSLAKSQGQLKDAVTRLEQSSGDDGASIESFVMQISKYTIGRHSQAYGLTLEEAIESLRDNTVFATFDDVSESYDRLVELDETWNQDNKHKALIYYAKDPEDGVRKYWHWVSDVDENGAPQQSWVGKDSIENRFLTRDFSMYCSYVWNKTDGTWVDGPYIDLYNEYFIGSTDSQYGGIYLFCEFVYDKLLEVWASEGKDLTTTYYAQDSDGNWKYWRYWYWDLDENGNPRLSWNGVNDYNDTTYIVISSKADIEKFKDYQYYQSTLYYDESESKYYYYDSDKNDWIVVKYAKFEDGALYRWNADDEINPYWQKVASADSNSLNRAIAQMRQSVSDTAAEFSTSLTNTKSDLVNQMGQITNQLSSYITTTTFDDKMAEIQLETDANEAKIRLLVSSTVEAIPEWDEDNTDQYDTTYIYYDTHGSLYYYWDGTTWMSAKDVNDTHIASKIRSGGIIMGINNGMSSIKISGDKIDIEGVTTFKDADGNLDTIIDGSKITTGTIDAQRLNVGKGASGSSVVVDPTGIDIYNGAFKIYDKNKKAILTINDDGKGSMYLSGNIHASSATIGSGSITSTHIANGAITTAKIDAGAITAAKIAAGTITATEIASGAITAAKIATGAITADKINLGQDNTFRINWATSEYWRGSSRFEMGVPTTATILTDYDISDALLNHGFVAMLNGAIPYIYMKTYNMYSSDVTELLPSEMSLNAYGIHCNDSDGERTEITSTYIYTTGLTYSQGVKVTSLESSKTNIVETGSMLDKIRNAGIYSYNYISDTQGGDDSGESNGSSESGDINIGLNGGELVVEEPEVYYGLVIGEDYNTPSEVIDSGGEHIDLYSMISLGWKGIQELADMVDTLAAKIEALENQNTTEE